MYIAAAAAKSLQLCLTLCNTIDCSPPGSSVHGDSPGENTGVGCHALLSSQPRDQAQVSCIAGRFLTVCSLARSLASVAPVVSNSAKPKNTGVGSLSPVQGIFLTQKSNPGSPALQTDSLPAETPGPPHCRPSDLPAKLRGPERR